MIYRRAGEFSDVAYVRARAQGRVFLAIFPLLDGEEKVASSFDIYMYIYIRYIRRDGVAR